MRKSHRTSKKPVKLDLARETVRSLSNRDLMHVEGASNGHRGELIQGAR